MPSKTGREHRFFGKVYGDPAFAEKVGVSRAVAKEFLDADKRAGKHFRNPKKKDPPMSKKGNSSGDAMAGGKMTGSMLPKGMGGEGGVSPRKMMAGVGEHEANTGNSGFGVQSFAEANSHGGHHPDHVAGTGAKGAMEDGDRAIGHGLHHTEHHHPSQAAPHHGPHHPDGYMHGHQHEDHPRHPHEKPHHEMVDHKKVHRPGHGAR